MPRRLAKSAAGVDTETALRLMGWMLLSRAIEDRLHALYKQGRLKGRLISGRGQEAIPVGATAALLQEEVVCPVHRDLGAHLVKGTTAREVLLHYFGRAAGPSGGRDGDIHMGVWRNRVFPMVSHLPDSWPIAVGIAHASVIAGQHRATLALCGDGASSTGLWHESLNFASVFQTPNVFVIENNQYAYSTPTARQYRIERLADRAAAYVMPSEVVDGNDVLAVYLAVTKAAERARAGGGPTLIEAMTMRMDGHAVHDGAGYVPAEILAEWQTKDPIERLWSWLLSERVEVAVMEEARSNARQATDEAVEFAEAAEAPDPATLTVGVYA